MEVETSSDIPVTELAETIGSTGAHPIKGANEILNQEGKQRKKEEEEAPLDGEFIKIEKESFEAKEGSHASAVGAGGEEDKPITEISPNNLTASRESLEAKEKIKQLELDLERVVGALKISESENAQLKEEILLTTEKFKQNEKKNEELELNHKKLQQQITEAEERHTSQLSTLQQAWEAQEAKHKELLDIRETLSSLSIELECSRKRTQELEQALQCSGDEVQKFEELHKQSSFHADSETQRALELEKLHEQAKHNAREVETQMAILQAEFKGLYDKVSENQKIEEALTRTSNELSIIQEELQLSKSYALDIEQRLSSKEALVDELTMELEARKASESQIKDDVTALEDLLALTKDDLQVKVSELEEIKLKLVEETKVRESIEMRVLFSAEEFDKVTKEKAALEEAIMDLTTNVSQMKELCGDLETKLKLSDESFCKTDSLLSHALSNNADLEQKFKSLEESSAAAAVKAEQKNIELEGMLQASSSAAEELKMQLKELETCFSASEQKNVELQQQLYLLDLKSSGSEGEVRELSEKLSELNALLNSVEKEKEQMNGQVQEYEDQITRLESLLSQSSSRNSELEMELKNVAEKCSEHEDGAKMAHQRSLELEDLFQMSNSKVEHAHKKASELELLLEAEKYRIQELEEQMNAMGKNSGDAEAESKKLASKVSDLTAELEAFEIKAAGLEQILQLANEKERDLMERLDVTTNEKKLLEEALNDTIRKLTETENLLKLLQDENSMLRENLERLESDQKVSEARENEITEMLRSAKMQIEQQGRTIEEATAKHLEIDSQGSEKISSLVRTNEELKRHISEIEDRAAQSFSENEMLVETNTQLKNKIQELQELLDSSISEKNAIFETQEKTLLSVKHLEGILQEMQTKSAQIEKENEGLAEANLKLTRELDSYESKINDLQAKLPAVLAEKDEAVEQLRSSMEAIKNLTEQSTSNEQKLQSQISMVKEENNQLNQAYQEAKNEVQTVRTQLESQVKEQETNENDLKVEIGKLMAEISENSVLPTHLKKLEKQLAIAELQLKEQVEGIKAAATAREAELSSKLEDQTTKAHDTDLLHQKVLQLQKELELAQSSFTEQIDSIKTAAAAREAELSSKLEDQGHKAHDMGVLHQRVAQLEKELELAQSSFAKQKEAYSQKDLERESDVNNSTEEFEAKNKQVVLLREQVRELEQKLQLADAMSKEKGDGSSQMEIKSRDIGSNLSSPSKRKSKKKSEAPPTHIETHAQTARVSTAASFKFVLAVALVSIVTGIILGKRY